MNGDGFLGILSGTQTFSGGVVLVSTNRGTGTNFAPMWQSRYIGAYNDSIETVLSVNLNGDNRPDIVAREIYGGRLITFMGTSNAVPFVEHQETSLGDRTFALAAGRVNSDSLDDLAVYVGWGEARVMVNQGGGVMSNVWTSPNLGEAAFNQRWRISMGTLSTTCSSARLAHRNHALARCASIETGPAWASKNGGRDSFPGMVTLEPSRT